MTYPKLTIRPFPSIHWSIHSLGASGICQSFMINRLPPEDQDRQSWQRAVELLLAAAEQQLERSLFLQAKWLTRA